MIIISFLFTVAVAVGYVCFQMSCSLFSCKLVLLYFTHYIIASDSLAEDFFVLNCYIEELVSFLQLIPFSFHFFCSLFRQMMVKFYPKIWYLQPAFVQKKFSLSLYLSLLLRYNLCFIKEY